MISREFQINISGMKVAATYYPSDEEAIPVEDAEENREFDLPSDRLTLETALLFENWLNLWGRISQSAIQLDSKTFRVVGTHLWKLILDNPIGEKLIDLIDDRTTRPLRVSINFEAGARKELRGLPWEFLCVPDWDKPIFLAAETNLLLTRYVELGDGRTRVTPANRLGVLFVCALPPRFERVREELMNLYDQVYNIPGVDAMEPIVGFDDEAISNAISNTDRPCHIVHVVGLCKGEVDDPKMYRPVPGSTDNYRDPKPLVDALTPASGQRPLLVILHLCEDDIGDADENFERLAPELIKRDIPAVLALQYPMPAEGIGADFYRELAKGESVGDAVQKSRNKLFKGKELNREFGTPVLYLEADGALRLPPTGLTTKSLVIRRPSPAAPSRVSDDVRLALLIALQSKGYGSSDDQGIREAAESLRFLLTARDAPDDAAELRDYIYDFTHRHQDSVHIYAISLELLQELQALRKRTELSYG